jgi:hypothetical protein
LFLALRFFSQNNFKKTLCHFNFSNHLKSINLLLLKYIKTQLKILNTRFCIQMTIEDNLGVDAVSHSRNISLPTYAVFDGKLTGNGTPVSAFAMCMTSGLVFQIPFKRQSHHLGDAEFRRQCSVATVGKWFRKGNIVGSPEMTAVAAGGAASSWSRRVLSLPDHNSA